MQLVVVAGGGYIYILGRRLQCQHVRISCKLRKVFRMESFAAFCLSKLKRQGEEKSAGEGMTT